MSKSKEKQQLENPFESFKIIKGEFETPLNNNEDIDDNSSTLVPEEDDLTESEKQRIIEANKKLEEQAEKIKNKKSKEQEDNINLDKEEDEEDINNETKPSLYKEFIKDQLDKGILDFEYKEEDFDDSEDSIDKAFGKTVESRINRWYEGLNPDFQKLYEYTQNGGDPKDFLQIYYNNHSWEDFNIDSEDNQKLVVIERLKLDGESDEDAKEMVTEWFDNGTLEKRAKSAITKLQKYEANQKEQILEIQKESSERSRKAQQEYWDNFKKDLFNREEIKGFKLTPKLKEKVWDHLTTIDKRTGKTGYQMKLENDREASLLFALQSATDFNSKELEKQVESKVSNKLGTILRNYTKTSKEKISSGVPQENDNENPFKGFQNIKI